MKKYLSLLLVLLLAFGLVGCGSPKASETPVATEAPAATEAPTEAPAANEESAESNYLVGSLIYAFANDYMSYVRKGISEEAERRGITSEIVDGNNDQAKQLDQADTLITKGANALIVAAEETEACQTFVDKSKAADIPLILVNKKPAQEVIDSYDKCWYVGAATQQPGECQAEMIVEDWAKHPEWDKNGDGILQYVLILGLKGHVNAEARVVGMNLVFDREDFKREELDMQEGKWDTTTAKDLTDAWMMKFGDKIEMIISNNDAMALGAIESMTANGYTGEKAIPVYGINAIEAGLQALRDGTMMGTVMSDMISEGAVCVQVADNVLNGKDPYEGISYDVVDKSIAIYGLPIRLENIADAEFMYQ